MTIITLIHHVFLLIYLTFCAYTDIRTMTVSLPISIVFSTFGCIFQFASCIPEISFTLFLISISIGIFLVFLSIISNNTIGSGDGLMLITTGTFLSVTDNISTLFYGLLLSSFYSLYKLIKTRQKKTLIPFAPFLLLGYLIVILT